MRSALLFFLVMLLSAFPAWAEGESEPPRNVLMIHSFGRYFAPFDTMAEEFRSELRQQSGRPIEFVETSLEMARFDGREVDAPLVDFLASVYSRRAPDLVVAVGAPSMQFYQRNRGNLFQETPILILGADKRRMKIVANDDQVASVSINQDLVGTAENIRRLIPGLKHLYVVSGTAPVDRFWEGEVRREWPPLLPGVELHWVNHFTLARMVDDLPEPAEDTAIFYALVTRDATGAPYEKSDALEFVAAKARVPVFGWAEEQLGKGIVGGPLMPLGEAGREAAGVAVRLLDGESPSAIDVSPIPPRAPAYDWRELRKWKIPKSRLPAGSAILFREPSLWETHRQTVLVTSGVLIAQSILIALLVAARKLAKERGASLQLATDAANVGFWQLDGHRQKITANSKWRGIFGLPGTGPVRLTDVLERIHPEDRKSAKALLENPPETNAPYQTEHRLIDPDGSIRWVASMGMMNAPGRDSATSSRGVSLDVTQRKESEAKIARQRSEMEHLSRVATLGELSGSLAHELNQPLGSILANAHAARRMLDKPTPDLRDLAEILDDIISEDERAGEVIRRLKDLLKRGEAKKADVDINECTREVLHLLRGELDAREVQVVQALHAQAAIAHADRVQIQQVILNLVANACESMTNLPPQQRRLSVRSSRDDSSIFLDVEDSGPGFSGDPEQLFQSFFSTKKSGLGLGLSICRSISTANHGRLWVEKSTPGSMVFRFQLPAA